jgi:hypothetical protein
MKEDKWALLSKVVKFVQHLESLDEHEREKVLDSEPGSRELLRELRNEAVEAIKKVEGR